MFEKTKEALHEHASEYGVSVKVWKELKDVENGVKKLLSERKQLEADAELGRAVRMAFGYNAEDKWGRNVILLEYFDDQSEYEIYSAEELLEWSRKQKGVKDEESC